MTDGGLIDGLSNKNKNSNNNNSSINKNSVDYNNDIDNNHNIFIGNFNERHKSQNKNFATMASFCI